MTERMISEFQQWWSRYPKKVAKFAAIKAYVKARTQASAEELLDGLERYRKGKPAWAEWAHPATWLNGGRWMDEVETRPASTAYTWVCPHDPKCHAQYWCTSGARDARDEQKRLTPNLGVVVTERER